MTRSPEHWGVELVVDGHDEVGEGPLWHQGRVIWVDIAKGVVYLLDPESTEREVVEVGQPVGAVAPRAAGGLVAAVQDGFAVVDLESGRSQMLIEVEADRPGNRMNDGKCDPQGRFWAGTMAFDQSPGAAALYRLDADHHVEKVLDSVGLSNGLEWSLEGDKMYYIDSLTYGVDVFDFEPATGGVANRRRLIDVSQDIGMPDGMTIDAEGYLWVALWEGSAVRRYAPDGTLVGIVELPASQVTSCTFGGVELTDLYITSAAADLTAADLAKQPHAGGLFRCRPGVRGVPGNEFGG
jgi:sugar lactone lactonase YvrE